MSTEDRDVPAALASLRDALGFDGVSVGYSDIAVIPTKRIPAETSAYASLLLARKWTDAPDLGLWKVPPPGDHWLVVGWDELGDPLIADSRSAGYPVYHLMHDPPSEPRLIARNYEGFLNALRFLKSLNADVPADLERMPPDQRAAAVRKLFDITQTDAYYWELMFAID